MKKIYFIRHGEGYHNLYNGDNNNYHLEYPRLTVKGLNQCFELKKKLNKIDFNFILVSPLRRTLETAVNIFDINSTYISLESIREFISNPCDYRESIKEISKEYNFVNFSSFIEENDLYNEKESDKDIYLRIDNFYNYLLKTDFETIAVVSHGEYLKRFFEKYGDTLNIENKKFMDNCGLEIGYL